MKLFSYLFLISFIFINDYYAVALKSTTVTEGLTQKEKTCDDCTISFYHNLHVPKNVIIRSYIGNENTIKELYQAIDYINHTERLTAGDGYNQKISLTVLMDDFFDSEEELAYMGEFADKFPVDITEKKSKMASWTTPFYIHYVDAADSVWIQDLCELGYITLRDKKQVPAVFDLNYEGPDSKTEIVHKISDYLNLTYFFLNGTGIDDSDSGDAGGNIETTHEGRIYVGSTMSKTLREDLKKKTGQSPVVLSTDWLNVGHVDEYLFTIPSDGPCGAIVVYADPLEALELVINDRTWKKPSRAAAIRSLKYFSKTGTLKKNLRISDFNLKKPIRRYGTRLEKIYGMYADWFVYQNLNAYLEIQNGVRTLKGSMQCKCRFVSLPVIFREPYDESYYNTGGVVSENPFTNALVLRDHIIMPRGRFSSLVIQRLKSPYKKNIHFIDTSWYEQNLGSIHCATQVVRDQKLIFKPVRKPQRKITKV